MIRTDFRTALCKGLNKNSLVSGFPTDLSKLGPPASFIPKEQRKTNISVTFMKIGWKIFLPQNIIFWLISNWRILLYFLKEWNSYYKQNKINMIKHTFPIYQPSSKMVLKSETRLFFGQKDLQHVNCERWTHLYEFLVFAGSNSGFDSSPPYKVGTGFHLSASHIIPGDGDQSSWWKGCRSAPKQLGHVLFLY